MLSFNNVEFRYSNQTIFTDLNFDLDEGEFAFLIGKSGVGKSTLLQMIYMNLLPTSGYVKVNGYDTKTIKTRQLPSLRKKLGVVFQDFKLLQDRNVYDNLAFVLEVTSTPRKEIKRKIDKVLIDVGLSNKRMNMPEQLSGGEQQRVAIARALLNDPLLILADEPTGNLDPETTNEILELLTSINKRGTAVLVATHNYDIVKKMNARIIKLDDGQAFKAIIKKKEDG
jgi:cell division transport system ATP-binding protein